MSKLDLLKEKLHYWTIQFTHYDSFYDETTTDYDSDNLVQEVIQELIDATKTKEDIKYKELWDIIDRYKLENSELKSKLNKIKDIL
jgi:hypothetical protein